MIQFQPDPPPTGVDPITAEWVRRQLVLLSQSTGTVAEVITIGADNTAAIQAEVDALELDLAAHVQNVVDAHGVDDKLVWAGVWSPGAYKRNDMVNDIGWLAVANVATTERPAPVFSTPAWMIVPEPVWGGANATKVFGVRITSTVRQAQITAIRLRAKQAGDYDLFLAIDKVRQSLAEALAIPANTWVTFYPGAIKTWVGSQIDVYAIGGSYNEAVDFFIAEPNIRGFLSDSWPPLPAELNDNAYGVDIEYSIATPSPDWDLLSVS